MKDKKKKRAAPAIDERESVEDVVRIDAQRVDSAYTRVPAELAYWSEKYSEALGRHLRAKALRKRTFAEQFLKIKNTSVEGKSPSEKVIEMKILTDDAYREVEENEIDTEVEKARIGGICEALSAKKDMLVSLGASIRADKSATNMRLKERIDDD